MLKKLIFHNRYLLRKKKNQEVLQSVEEIRQQYLYNAKKSYYPPILFEHQQLVQEKMLYGNSHYIVGLTPSSFLSSMFVNQAMRKLRPNHIILGGINNDSFNSFDEYEQNKKLRKPILYKPEDMFCKALLLPAFEKELCTNPEFVFDEENNVFLFLNEEDKRIQTNDYFTAAYLTLKEENCKLSFGKPSDLVILEDIILSASIEEMYDAFYRVLQKVKEKYSDKTFFQSSYLLDYFHYEGESQAIFYKKEIAYTASLFNKFSSLGTNSLLFTSCKFVNQIAQLCDSMHVHPSSLYRSYLTKEGQEGANYKKLQRMLNAENKEQIICEILEKFAILSLIKGNNLENKFIIQESNIFQNSIFAPLFKDIPIPTLFSYYRTLKRPYALALMSIQDTWIENMLKTEVKKENILTLPQQLQILDKREKDFPFQYEPFNLLIEKRQLQCIALIDKEIQNIVKSQYSEYDVQVFQNHKEGNVTKQSLILMTKLMVKAKLKLKLTDFKFPRYHYGAFQEIFKSFALQQNEKKENPSLIDKAEKLRNSMKKPSSNFISIKTEDDLRYYLSIAQGKVRKVKIQVGGKEPRIVEGSQEDAQKIFQHMQLQKVFKEVEENSKRQGKN